jgi:hypothetical protein
VRVAVDQHAEQGAGAAAYVADPGHGRPVERRGEGQAVEAPPGGHGVVEGAVAVGVGGVPVEERGAVGGGEGVGDPGVGAQAGDGGDDLGPGGELDPGPPAARVVAAQEPGGAGGAGPAPVVDPQPAPPGGVGHQPPDQLGVGVDLLRQVGDRAGPVEPVGDVEVAQRRQRGVVEQAEDAFEHLDRRRRQAPVHPGDEGPQPGDRRGHPGRRQRGRADDVARVDGGAHGPRAWQARGRGLSR